MSWSRIIAVTTMILFVFGFIMIDSAVAGEKSKWKGTSFNTETKSIEVGDEEGHVLVLTKSKHLSGETFFNLDRPEECLVIGR
jgi:hypothetical protein